MKGVPGSELDGMPVTGTYSWYSVSGTREV